MKEADNKCPIMHGSDDVKQRAGATFANRQWWPEQLNLKQLSQNGPQVSPLDETSTTPTRSLRSTTTS